MKISEQNSGRIKAAIIFLTPIIVLIASTALFYSGFSPTGKTNNGALLSPPLDLSSLQVEVSEGPLLDEFPGKWTIVHLLDGTCSENCWKTLYSSRQVNIRLAKNSARVSRYLLLNDNSELSKFDRERIAEEYPMLKLGKYNSDDLPEKVRSSFPYGPYILFDPLGNGVLKYDVRLPGGELLQDLKKLLTNSKVG